MIQNPRSGAPPGAGCSTVRGTNLRVLAMGGKSAGISSRARVREKGLTIGTMATGQHNAITDVEGVGVGHCTLVEGEGSLVPGKGPIRTGVTAILPHSGDLWNEKLSGAGFVLNGNGSITGLDWVSESGYLEGPILLTNTLSVGTVYDAAISWLLSKYPRAGIDDDTFLPIVAECDDSFLNDSRGRHVKEEHVLAALNTAKGGAVEEGAVGAGTGMTCYEFKGGIGTSSRVLPKDAGGYTLGVLANCNHGKRTQLTIDGVPVGRFIPEDPAPRHKEGSIVIVVATDAPLNAVQLRRICMRAGMGLARTGSTARNTSGDFIIAFSTGRRIKRHQSTQVLNLPELHNDFINPLFQAAADATEEAVLNALFTAPSVKGRDNRTANGLPVEKTLELLKQYGRLT